MSRTLRRAIAALVMVGAAINLTSLPAYATDNGYWVGTCYDTGRGCFWRNTLYDGSYGQLLASNTRDSNFNNDYWAGSTTSLNDHAKWFSNSFSTLNIAAYKNADYVTITWCLPPNYAAGPFSIGIADGLSSFKSC
jgi:hypothetical protein